MLDSKELTIMSTNSDQVHLHNLAPARHDLSSPPLVQKYPYLERPMHQGVNLCLNPLGNEEVNPDLYLVEKSNQFIHMPLEIVYQIAQHLEPLSLLFLSRTNKPLRSLLMSGRVAPFWRSAVERDPNLPPRPKELSDPQYVTLLLTNECTACGNSTDYTLDFVLLTRLCGVCRSEKVINLECVKYYWLVYSSPELAPPNGGQWKNSNWCLQAEVECVNQKIIDFKTVDGSPNPDCMSWIREQRKSIAGKRQAAQEMSDWIAKRKQEREGKIN